MFKSSFSLVPPILSVTSLKGFIYITTARMATRTADVSLGRQFVSRFSNIGTCVIAVHGGFVSCGILFVFFFLKK